MMSGRGVMTSRTTRLGEVDDRLQQLPSFFLRDDALVFGALARSLRPRCVGCGGSVCRVRRRGVSGVVAVPPDIDDVHQRNGQRARQPRKRREHGQQHVEHRFRIVPRDKRGKQVLAHDDERASEIDEHRDRARIADVAHARDQDAGGDQAAAEQQPDRDEELERIVEIAPEPIAAAAALGHETQRQPHQRAEGGLHGAEKHRGASEQEQRERGHARSIKPSTSPPRRRSRRSSRAMRPSSRS